MTSYKTADKETKAMAADLICTVDQHGPLAQARIRLDILFAFPEYDENGEPVGFAIQEHGWQVYGQTRLVNLRDRVKGMGDAEIILCGETWKNATELQRRALLDHELTHLEVLVGKLDDQGRPKLKLRHHDVEVGWFATVADRHGAASVERIQAAKMLETRGQTFWPEILDAARK